MRDESPFGDLVVPTIRKAPEQSFIDQWIKPFYLRRINEDFAADFAEVASSIDAALVKKLLIWANWRSRKVGAIFAAAKGLIEFEDQLGKLLLRSDVCYAGQTYCLALARFNTTNAAKFLGTYLDYYLTRPDLRFDQNMAMAAVAYLDQVNQSSYLEQYLPSWQAFSQSKPEWDLSRQTDSFAELMGVIEKMSLM